MSYDINLSNHACVCVMVVIRMIGFIMCHENVLRVSHGVCECESAYVCEKMNK